MRPYTFTCDECDCRCRLSCEYLPEFEPAYACPFYGEYHSDWKEEEDDEDEMVTDEVLADAVDWLFHDEKEEDGEE